MSYTYGEIGTCKLAGGATSSYYQCRLGYQVNSQNILNRLSSITLRYEVRSTSSSYATRGYKQTSIIDGTSLSAKTFDMSNTNSWQLFGEKTITVVHNPDGTYSSLKSASFTTNASGTYSLKSGSASVLVAPPTIPTYASCTQSLSNKTLNSITMNWSSDSAIDYIWYSINNGESWVSLGSLNNVKSGSYTISNLDINTTYYIKTRIRRHDSQLTTDSSTLNVTTYNGPQLLSVPNINIGDSHTITWSNPSGSALELALYNSDGTSLIQKIEGITGTSKTIKPNPSLIYPLTVNSNNIELRYVLSTTLNGKKIIDLKNFTASVINSNPTFSNFDFEDINAKTLGLTGNKAKFIKKYSNIKATITSANKMTIKNSAVPYYYNMIVGDKSEVINYSASSTVTGTINNMNGNIINIYAIDSRNNQTRVSKAINVIDYTECQLSSMRVDRVDGIGTNIKFSITGTYSNINFGKVTNTIKKIEIRAKPEAGSWSNWNDITNLISITNGKVSAENVTYSGINFALGTTYEVEIRISDELSSNTENGIISDGKFLWSAAKGQGVCFGGIYDTQEGGALQVNGKKIEYVEMIKVEDNLTSDSTTSALSAKQGKLLNEEIEKILSKCIITVGMSKNYEFTTDGEKIMVLDVINNQNGTGISLKNNKIYIDRDDISYIKLSASAVLTNCATGATNIIIRKNGNNYCERIGNWTSDLKENNPLSIPVFLDKVKKGDYFELVIYANAGTYVSEIAYRTFLTVEEVVVK